MKSLLENSNETFLLFSNILNNFQLFYFSNNNNQDNINNNNQMSSSADAENMGNARSLPHDAFCYVAKNEAHKGTLENVMTSILGFLLLDYVPSLKHENVLKIMENPLSNCVK